MPDLTDTELQILDLERSTWRYAGTKEQAIRDRFDWTATRYYQSLGVLIDWPEALEHSPQLVNRLRRLRADRQRSRGARRGGVA